MTSGYTDAFEITASFPTAPGRARSLVVCAGPMTLADLKKGDRAVIMAIRAAEPSVQRLMIMGLVEGAELECIGASLGGDPIEYRLFGGSVSLRRADGSYFDVVRKNEHG